MSREDIILMIASGAQGPYDLDPIRVMKACFVVSQRGKDEWKGEFDFGPYDYGPFDSQVYSARDVLIARGHLTADTSKRYPSYVLSDAGREQALAISQSLTNREADWLRSIGQYVTSKSFSRLLDEIYERFPEFAVRSIRH